MKKFLFIFAILVLFSVSLVHAQFVTSKFTSVLRTPDTYVVDATFTADSGAAVFYSPTFFPDGFNQQNWGSYPITATYDLATASSTPKVIIALYGIGANSNKFVLDSLGIGTGVGDTLVSNTANKCVLTVSGGYRFQSYCIGVTQIATGKAITNSKLQLVFTKPKTN